MRFKAIYAMLLLSLISTVHMTKINPNSLKQLKPNKSSWNYPKTVAIRVPENIKDNVLNYAKYLDSNSVNINSFNPTVQLIKIKSILAKIEKKESGYKTNSASKLIADLKQLINEVE